jgi:tRNA splicing ligase
MEIEGYAHSVSETGRVTYSKSIEGKIVWDFDVSGSDIDIFKGHGKEGEAELKRQLDAMCREDRIASILR